LTRLPDRYSLKNGIVLHPQEPIDTVLNDSTILSGVSTTRLNVAGQVVGDGLPKPTFISCQISVFSGGINSALSGLQQRFNAFALPTTWVKDNLINIKTKVA
jgi:hypothetical protein